HRVRVVDVGRTQHGRGDRAVALEGDVTDRILRDDDERVDVDVGAADREAAVERARAGGKPRLEQQAGDEAEALHRPDLARVDGLALRVVLYLGEAGQAADDGLGIGVHEDDVAGLDRGGPELRPRRQTLGHHAG